MTVAFKLLLILVKQSQIRARGAASLPSLHTQLIFINQEGGFFLLFFFFKKGILSCPSHFQTRAAKFMGSPSALLGENFAFQLTYL